MAHLRFENPKNRILLTITTNERDARRALTVTLAGEAMVLSALEAQNLLEWLYQQRDAIFALANAPEKSEE